MARTESTDKTQTPRVKRHPQLTPLKLHRPISPSTNPGEIHGVEHARCLAMALAGSAEFVLPEDVEAFAKVAAERVAEETLVQLAAKRAKLVLLADTAAGHVCNLETQAQRAKADAENPAMKSAERARNVRLMSAVAKKLDDAHEAVAKARAAVVEHDRKVEAAAAALAAARKTAAEATAGLPWAPR